MSEKKIELMELEEIVPEYQSRFRIVQWLFHKRLELALEYVRRVRPHVLLDAGCGDGSFIKLLANDPELRDMHVTGLDLNQSITRLEPEFPSYSFVIGSILETGFPDEAFGAVVALDMLEHLIDAQVAAIELKRIVKNGGYLITSEPVESFVYKSLRFLIKGTFSQESGPCSSPHYNNARGIDRIMRAAGFTLLQSKKIPLPPPFDLFHINLYQKK